MKKKLYTGLLVMLVIWIILGFSYNVVPVMLGKSVASKFFVNLVNQDYTSASSYIKTKNLDKWISMVEQLGDNGVVLSDNNNLRISLDDGALMGQTTINLLDNGVKKNYNIFIFFDGNKFSPKISNVQYLIATYGNDETIKNWVTTINPNTSPE